jgi:hypothetical protein
VRHLLAVSEQLHTNGTAGRTILLRYRREEAWATLASFLGLPADPSWADHVLSVVERKRRIEEIDGIGCEPVLVSATTEEMLEWIGEGLRSSGLTFPVTSGPILWPQVSIGQVLGNSDLGPGLGSARRESRSRDRDVHNLQLCTHHLLNLT